MNAPPERHLDATPTNDTASLAVLAVEVRYIRSAVDEIRTGNQQYVTRNEWQLRNDYVDGRFVTTQAELNSRKVSWPAVAALVVAISVALFDLIPLLAN